MGCHQCYECGDKFEAYTAEEYAGSDEEADYDTCPGCLEKSKRDNAQKAELVALRAEVKTLRKKVAASNVIDLCSDASTSAPPAKKAKVSGTVWVLVKGDWPDHPNAQLVDVDVLGTYSSSAKAEAAKEEFIEEGGWMEGYGYHQGESSESTIKIISKTIDASAF